MPICGSPIGSSYCIPRLIFKNDNIDDDMEYRVPLDKDEEADTVHNRDITTPTHMLAAEFSEVGDGDDDLDDHMPFDKSDKTRCPSIRLIRPL